MAVRRRATRSTCAAVVLSVLAALPGVLSPTASAAPSASSGGPSPWAGGLTGATEWLHDPTVAKEEDRWYVFSTGPRIFVRSSTDLVHWEEEGSVFAGGWPPWLATMFPGPDENMWAPDVEFFDGRWHLYYSRADFGTQRAAIGVATSPTLDPGSPDFGWTDHGPVIGSDEGSGGVTAIDPDMVIDERGDPWLVWGSFWGGIALAPIDPATAKLTPGAVPTIVAKRPRWFDGIEGPNIVLRDGWWWLFTAWGFCCQGLNSHYAIRVGRSRALAGPYLDMAGRPLLEGGGTLLLGSHGDRHGLGHGTAFESPHGWTMAHHYYSRSNDGRQTLGFVPMVELDGWPLGIEPDATLADEPKPLAAGTWRVIPYPENDDPRQSTPPATSTVGLRSDGSVAGGGRWWSDENVVRVEATAMRGTGGTVPRTRLALLVDAGGAVAFGRDQDGAALRLERTGPEPGPDPVPVPVPSPPMGASAAPPAAPVRAAPAYVG